MRAMTNSQMPLSPLAGMAVLRDARSRRVSSWDRSGRNDDFIVIEPGATAELADIKGPGCIRHIWITTGSDEPHYLRKLILRCCWEDESTPSVEVPLSDFFCCGHAVLSHFVSLPFSVIKTPGLGVHGAMNCYLPMPFARRARICIENQGDLPVRSFYYHIDYEEWDKPDETMGRLHAFFNAQTPTRAVEPRGAKEPVNLSDKRNYPIADIRGRGHFAGCVLSVFNHTAFETQKRWWGEGDEMIFIDGEKWPPSLHGTGTEDYFCAAWGFPSKEFSGPYVGLTIGSDVDNWSGMWTAYRFHIEDPIHFRKSLRFSIEHGHANDKGNDYASVAYWYQVEPHAPFPPLVDLEARVPRYPFVRKT